MHRVKRNSKVHMESNKIACSHNNFYFIISLTYHTPPQRCKVHVQYALRSISKFNPYLPRVSLKKYCISSITD